MSNTVEIRVPDIGDFSNVPVIDVLVQEGADIEVDTPLITLETEKATMDVPSNAAGRIVSLKVSKGAKLSKGDLIAVLEPAGAASEAQEAKTAPAPTSAADSQPSRIETPVPTAGEPGKSAEQDEEAASAAAPASPPQPKPQPQPSGRSPAVQSSASDKEDIAYASPSVRKFARELGVDLARVGGSGLKNRITHDDVKGFVKKSLTQPAPAAAGSALPKIPVVDFAKFGPVDTQPLSRIQRISGTRLTASWVNIPHVTQFDQADITELEEARSRLKEKANRQGIKLTPLAFIIRACVKALKEFPRFGTSLDPSGEKLIYKKYLHIGFAADTPNGLVVPVIRDADKKDIYEIARELGELSAKAREGKLTVAELQGGCFTVSSLGSIGGTAFTPIINAPEVAILGVARAEHKPIYRDGGFVPRLILPFSLSYDHRVIDGAAAVRFTTYLAEVLANVNGLLEAVP